MLIIEYYVGKNKRRILVEEKYFKNDPNLDYIEIGVKQGDKSKIMTIPKVNVGLIKLEKMEKGVASDKIVMNPVTGY